MGGNVSKASSEINNTIRDSVGLYIDDVQHCNQVANDAVIISQISSCGGGDQLIEGVSFDSTSVMNQQCMADFKVTSEIKRKIKEDLQQTAEAVTEGLGIGYNSSDAETIMNLTTELSTVVNNSFEQAANSVTTKLLSLSQVKTGECTGGNQIIRDISFKSYSNAIQDAVSKAVSESKVTTQIDQVIKQSSSALTKGLDLNFLAAIIGAVVVVIVLFMYGGITIAKSLITTPTGMVITLVVIYLVVAGMTGLFPFSKSDDEGPNARGTGDDIRLPCTNDSQCGDGFKCIHQVCRIRCSEDDECHFPDNQHPMSCNAGACTVTDD